MASWREKVVLAALGLALFAPLAAVAWVEVEIPESGLHFVDLAGRQGTIAWRTERVTVRGSLRRGDDGTASGKLRLEAIGAAFEDDSGALIGQGIRVDATLEIDALSENLARGRVELLCGAGELLADRFYVDLSLYPVSVSARLEVPLGPDGIDSGARVAFRDGAVEVPGVGTVRAGGEARLDTLEIQIDAIFEVDGLARLYELAVVEPFAAGQPWLTDTGVRGVVRGELAYRRGAAGAFRISGEVEVRDAELYGPDPGWQIGELRADLPFDLGTAAAEAGGAGEPRSGVVELAGAVVQGIALGATTLPIVAGDNTLELQRPTKIPVLGGRIDVRSARATRLIHADRGVTFSVDLDGLDLAVLAEELGLPPLEGQISGSIPEIEIAGGALRSRGEIVADVFAGRVRARNLRGDGLGTAVPSFGLDAEFDNISLGDLTGALAFGYVSGIARGAVKGLELVSTGPVAFDAWLESVPASGVSQRISVDAIRQISIVGGSGSDPLSAGVLSIFDEYRYSKLGFQCSLENDVFLIDGIEVTDGKHYIVVAATLPPRVDVVIHNRKISFSDMMRRLDSALASEGPK